MKNLLPKAAALVLATAGLLTQSAHAQYAQGNLLLDLQGSSGNDYVVDLSQSAASYVASSSDIVYQMSLTALNSALGSSSSDTSWETSASWFVMGASSDGLKSMYASEVQNTPGTQNTTGLLRQSSSTQGNAQSSINTIGGQTAGPGTTATVSDTGNFGANNPTINGHLSQVTQVNTFTSGGLSSAASDLTVETSANPSLNLLGSVYGYFTFSIDSLNSSLVDFTYNVPSVAVPEPTTYGLLAGTGLLALCLGQQLRRKQQA